MNLSPAIANGAVYRALDPSLRDRHAAPLKDLDSLIDTLSKFPPARDALLDQLAVHIRNSFAGLTSNEETDVLMRAVYQLRTLATRTPHPWCEVLIKWALAIFSSSPIAHETSSGMSTKEVMYRNLSNGLAVGLMELVRHSLTAKTDLLYDDPTVIKMSRILVEVVFPENDKSRNGPPQNPRYGMRWVLRAAAETSPLAVSLRVHEAIIRMYSNQGFPRVDVAGIEKTTIHPNFKLVFEILLDLEQDSIIRIVNGLVVLVSIYQDEVKHRARLGSTGTSTNSEWKRYIVAYIIQFIGTWPEYLPEFRSEFLKNMDVTSICLNAALDATTSFSLYREERSPSPYPLALLLEGVILRMMSLPFALSDPAGILILFTSLFTECGRLMTDGEYIEGPKASSFTPLFPRTDAMRDALRRVQSTTRVVCNSMSQTALDDAYISKVCASVHQNRSFQFIKIPARNTAPRAQMLESLYTKILGPSLRVNESDTCNPETDETEDFVADVLESCLIAEDPSVSKQIVKKMLSASTTDAADLDTHDVTRLVRSVAAVKLNEEDWRWIVGPTTLSTQNLSVQQIKRNLLRILFCLPILTAHANPDWTTCWKTLSSLLTSEDKALVLIARLLIAEITPVKPKVRQSDMMKRAEDVVDIVLGVFDGWKTVEVADEIKPKDVQEDAGQVVQFVMLNSAKKSIAQFRTNKCTYVYLLSVLVTRILSFKSPAQIALTSRSINTSDEIPASLKGRATFLTMNRKRKIDTRNARNMMPRISENVFAKPAATHVFPSRLGSDLTPRSSGVGKIGLQGGRVVSMGGETKDGKYGSDWNEINRAYMEAEGVRTGMERKLTPATCNSHLMYVNNISDVLRSCIQMDDTLTEFLADPPMITTPSIEHATSLARVLMKQFDSIAFQIHCMAGTVTRFHQYEERFAGGIKPIAFEWDTKIRQYFFEHPNIWSVLSILAEAKSLEPCHPILYSLLATMIGFWERAIENDPFYRRAWELWATTKLVQIFCKSGYLPTTLIHLPETFSLLSTKEISQLLHRVVWPYLRNRTLTTHASSAPDGSTSYIAGRDGNMEREQEQEKLVLQIVRNALRKVFGRSDGKGEEAVRLYPLFC